MNKALIISYSQASQTDRALHYFTRGLQKNFDCEYVKISPKENFKFPWKISEFFRVFPRAVQGISGEIEPLEIEWSRYELVILAGQVWFLSPSLPLQSFLKNEVAKGLQGKPVITLLTCRNLWHSASRRLRQSLQQIGARHLGQITIAETGPVWASFVTTPRWMLTGKKQAFAFFPAAGISESEFKKLEEKGQSIVRRTEKMAEWQMTEGIFGSNVNKVSLVLMDQIGYGFFLFWSSLILKLARRPGIWQDFLLVLFRLNLVIMIIVIGPCTKVFEWFVSNHPKYLDRS